MDELLDELDEEIAFGRVIQDAELFEDDRVDRVPTSAIRTGGRRRGGRDRPRVSRSVATRASSASLLTGLAR